MNELLSNLSDALAAAVSTARPQVVRIEARKRFPASGVIWSADGIIVTNHHVVHRADAIGVGLEEGRTLTARLVGRDETTDLAVLRVDADGLAAGASTGMDRVGVGNLVLALGRPGRSARATLGIVSALGDAWKTPARGVLERYLQTDLTLHPGFTGGPLVDTEGRILGITSSGILRGISLAVPNGTVGSVVATILEHGRIPRGYLGISSYPVRLPHGIATKLGQDEGLLIVDVEPESPAERGGLMQGDVILSIGGETVSEPETLLAFLTGDRIGTEVEIRAIRAGSPLSVGITVGRRRE